MSRIFLSHSSTDEREAVALRQWLADNGWDDVFLDMDPERGLTAGERWQEALRNAADRCEAVVCILSPAWARSKWCLAELLLAKNLRKLIFGVLLKEVPIGELPTEMTSEWQLCQIFGSGPTETIRFTYHGTAAEIAFQSEGLKRLKDGLQKAGLTADFFPWPPKDDPDRVPYRGLEPLDACDAAIFFGRDVEILRGLETLRGMRESANKKLFVVLGASGAGKSSFLRAGLLPRLARNDRYFFPLAVIRPEREPLFGRHGLANALHQAYVGLKLPSTNLGEIKASLRKGPEGLAHLLQEVQGAARFRLVASSEDPAPPKPTLIIPLDQAEELFNADAGEESRAFLQMIGAVLRAETSNADSAVSRIPMVLAITIRSDCYEPLQTAPELAGLQGVVFDDLKPMPPTRYREVILGPAKRASVQAGKLEIQPDLVERLVAECAEGGDALPLLGLTLARLYRDFGSDGDLRLDEYETMGGLADIVKREAESILAQNEVTRREQLALLHAAFIPWLVTINPRNDQPMRRVARRADLPAESHPLIDLLAEKRLLLRDKRGGESVVEIAHEALLRNWPQLRDWLAEDRDKLRLLDSIQRAGEEWVQGALREDLLVHRDGRLKDAEALLSTPRFTLPERSTERAYVNACCAAQRAREAAEREEQERRIRDAERIAEEQRKAAEAEKSRADAEASRVRSTRIGLVIALALLAFAIGLAWVAYKERRQAQFQLASLLWVNGIRERDHHDDPLKAGHYFMHASALASDETTAKHALLAAKLATGDIFLETILELESPVKAAFFIRNENHVTVWNEYGERRVWDGTGSKIQDTQQVEDRVGKEAFLSPAGRRIVLSIGNGKFLIRDSQTGALLITVSHEEGIPKFNADENRLLTWTSHDDPQVWDLSEGRRISLLAHARPVRDAIFSRGGDLILTWGEGGPACLWGAGRGEKLAELPFGHKGIRGAAFGMDESRLLIWDKEGNIWLRNGPGNTVTIQLPSGGYPSPTMRAEFLQNDRRVLIMNHGGLGRVHIRDIQNEALSTSFVEHTDAVIETVLTRDQKRILTCSDDRTARFWDAYTGTQILPALHHRDRVLGAVFNADETLILTWSADGTARVWDSRSGQLRGQLQHRKSIRGAAFSKDDKRILTWSEDGSARVWRIREMPKSFPIRHEDRVLCAAYNKVDDRLLTMSRDKGLRVWSNKGESLVSFKLTSDALGARLSSDGKASRMVTWEDGGTIRVWCTQTGEPITPPFRHETHDPRLMGVDFGPGERWVLSWADDGMANVWDSQTGSLIFAKPHSAGVLGAQLSEDGSCLLTWTDDRNVHLWHKDREEPLWSLPHAFGVRGAALTRDGNRILSWDSNGAGRVWDAHRGLELGEFQHDSAIRGARFDRSEERILSWSKEGARIWDSRQSNKALTPILSHDEVLGGGFNSDGQQILTWGEGGRLRLWDSRYGYPLSRILCFFRQDAGPIDSASLIHDDRQILIVSNDAVWVLDLPVDREPVPRESAWFHHDKVDEARGGQEVLTGTRLNSANETEVLSFVEWKKRKSQLEIDGAAFSK